MADATTVVTGGGSGMGRQIALSLAHSGSHVTIVGRRRDPLEAVASQAPAQSVSIVEADLGAVPGADGLADATASAEGVQGFVAAAGGQGSFMATAGGAMPAELAWQRALRKNLYSAVLPIEAILPQLLDGRSRVVLISSLAALDGSGGPYATAKAALHGYAYDLARRLAPRGITANVVAPGLVGDTEFFEAAGLGESRDAAKRAASQVPLGRAGTPEDIASLVAWLLSEDAGWITGQVISPNGGQRIGS
jgi:3-oxoacyl-[acyl-carrier protein] reductase